MMRAKLWVILGSEKGLGSAAVRYLVSNGQTVIALTNGQAAASPFAEHFPHHHVIDTPIIDIRPITMVIKALTTTYGPIDYIINNADYNLFADPVSQRVSASQYPLKHSLGLTLITTLLPFLRQIPKGSLINLPPQLCLATISDKCHAQNLAAAMDIFLDHLYRELNALDCRLVFLQPGMRLADHLFNTPEN